MSPGKPRPSLDESGEPLPGSISENVFIDVNRVQEGMFIRSKDVSHPVLLYLHGGMPDYFLTQKYPTGLEDYFTVVWWEQRGSGISYSANIPRETMTPEQMISDTIEVTNYLRRRFGKEKIYLMGHSGERSAEYRPLGTPPTCIMPTSAWLRCQINSSLNGRHMNTC
jgi:pimeloyl-ACP methyl ester carboxylesterase